MSGGSARRSRGKWCEKWELRSDESENGPYARTGNGSAPNAEKGDRLMTVPESSVLSEVAFADFTRDVESDLGIPPGFLSSLDKLDDWACVIQAHAVIEASLTHLLVGALGRHELADAFARLELSAAKTGKVVFAEALGLLAPEERRFIRLLSEIRNRLVHDIRNATFSLQQYASSLDPQQSRNFVQALGLPVWLAPAVKGRAAPPNVMTALTRGILAMPKLFLASCVSCIAYKAHYEKARLQTRRAAVTAYAAAGKVFFGSSAEEGTSGANPEP